jgi:hypothetical protein
MFGSELVGNFLRTVPFSRAARTNSFGNRVGVLVVCRGVNGCSRDAAVGRKFNGRVLTWEFWRNLLVQYQATSERLR